MKAAFFIAVALLVAAAPAAGAADNILRRDAGIVTYKLDGAAPTSLTGAIAVGDKVIATTAVGALARLSLRDSSEIRIGDRTTVRIGDLRVAEESSPSSGTIYLQRGAVRFNVLHPSGGRANYRFVTPTAQLGVRGTLGYLVVGPNGNQIYCVRCEAGDVTITTATKSVELRSGQTLNIAVAHGAVVGSEIVANRTINNPAIDQFLGGVSPFGQTSRDGKDFTASGSGLTL